VTDKHDKKNFLDFCKYQAALVSLAKGGEQEGYRVHKQLMYFAFLITLPFHRPISTICYLAAILCNILDRKKNCKAGSSIWQIILTDEDSLTMFNIMVTIFCGKIYSALLAYTLIIWAFLNVCEAGYHLAIEKDLKSLKSFRVLFEWTRVNRFWLVQIKTNIEVFVCLSSPLAWIGFAGCAPLLPVIYVQIIRLKYVTSPFNRDSFAALDNHLSFFLPESAMEMIRTRLRPATPPASGEKK
jgi:hypothetical protein